MATQDLTAEMLAKFRQSVHLLLVDDDYHILSSLKPLFSGELCSVTTASSLSEALSTIKSSDQWHCWVLDVDLGEGHSGLDVVRRAPGFPYFVILSGLKSMATASQAVKLGAMDVYDKDPNSLDVLVDGVCRIAALGHILGGKATKYLPVFRILTEQTLERPEKWAARACVSLRQLQRICELHELPSVRHSLSHYYALYSLLWKTTEGANANSLPPLLKGTEEGFIQECMKVVLKG